MGVNNQQRRAAKTKQRQRARRAAEERQRRRDGSGSRSGWAAGWPDDQEPVDGAFWGGDESPFGSWEDPGPGWAEDPSEIRAARVEAAVGSTLRQLVGSRRPVSIDDARQQVTLLRSALAPAPVREIGRVLTRIGHTTWRSATRGGWDATELEELVRRRAGEEHLGTLDLVTRGADPGADLERLSSVLLVTALLLQVPAGRPPAGAAAPVRRSAVSEESAKKLATVRALLAKAERTSFDEEAETLSAKAQELISRYALERLIAEDRGSPGVGATVGTARIWLDNPYLMAKASLVNAVAAANRCRCVVSEALGLCSVVGEPADLDAVQLLSTSLMVQANRSMLRHGRQVDHRGASRTRSFRQSFLVAFAHRIGERLQEVSDDAVRESSAGTDLVPVLRARQQQVDQAFETLFPDIVATGTSVSNGLGWAAGRAAADDAAIDLRTPVDQAPSR